jgi:xanthine permease
LSEERAGETRHDVRPHPVNEVMPPGRMMAYGLQHILVMYTGVITVPLVLATAIGLPQEELAYIINACLLTCGVATLIQTIGFWKIGVRLPIIMGTSFAAAIPMIQIGDVYGLQGIYGAVIVSGIFVFLISPYFSLLLHFFPPVVTGTVITVIGLSIMPVAVRWAAGGDPEAENFGNPVNIAMAFVVLLLIVVITRFFGGLVGGFVGRIAILLGLMLGTIIAALFGLADFGGVAEAGWLRITTPFYFGLPTFHLVPIISMMIAMLVIMVETTADTVAIGEITDRPIRQDNLARALRTDGFSTVLGGVLNAFPITTFSQNVGLVRFTNVKSRFVAAVGGIILILIGIFPKLGAVVAAIPIPVLGGAGLMLFGTIAIVGIQILSRVDFEDNRNLVTVAVSLGLGLIPVAVPDFYGGFPIGVQMMFESGIAAATIAAVLLNLFFKVLGGKQGEIRG